MRFKPTVSDADREQIKTLWAKGVSSGVIAASMGRTRSSVMGLVSRMKLPSRPTENTRPGYHWPTDTPRIRKKRPQPLPRPPVLPTEIITVGIPLISARDNQCRYPLWVDNGAPDFQVCGTVSVGVYCPKHFELCCTSRMAK